MKQYYTIILISFFFFSSTLQTQAQQKKATVIESENAYAEKIYIQLSSTIFTNDKTVWFKAIVTDLAHLPTKLSGVLHVELIDFDKRIIDKKKLKLENGIANSYFQLTEDMPAGRYLIRAYTEWNKNFDTAFISQNYIQIYEPNKVVESDEAIRNITLTETSENQFQLSATAYPKLIHPKYRGKLKMYIHADDKTDSVEIKKEKDDSYSFNYVLPKETVKARIELKLDSLKVRNNNFEVLSSFSKTVAVDKHFLDAQFFPEGGKFVDGLTSRIGFKILDYKNEGVEITGQIIDENDAIIIPFKSNALGMGVTYLTPNIEKTYYAQIKNNDGVLLKFPLPEVHKSGVVLNVKTVDEYLVVGLKSKNETEFQVKVQSRGVVYDDFMLQLKNGSASTGIEKIVLPEGIIKITITNLQNQIIAERLFFNFKEEDRLVLMAKPHLAHYSQRDKTVLDLTSIRKDSTGIVSNLSVSVINKEQLGAVNNLQGNILSYFLLNSELRGNIEQPSYYFNPENRSRIQDMDALMLTQGWTNYVYKNSEIDSNFKFLPEQNLTVSGTVKDLISSKKPIKNPIELTMVYGPLQVATQKVDSTGVFNFQLKDYYKDEFKVVIQSKTENDKKKDFRINIDKHQSPHINYTTENNIALADSTTIYVNKNIERKQVERDFNAANGTITLDEVKLDGYNLTPARQKMMELHGLPDVVVENKELISKVKPWHTGLYDLLKFNYPNDIDIYTIRYDEFGMSTKDLIYKSVGLFEPPPPGWKSPAISEVLIARDYDTDFTFIVIDGIPVDIKQYKFLEDLPTEEIKSVELIRRPKYPRHYVLQAINEHYYNAAGDLVHVDFPNGARISIISIYTYAGKGYYGLQRTPGVYKGFVSGFTPKLEFYAPKYDNEEDNDWNVPDLRSVVHWAPNVKTDENGEARVEFYNADNIGDMQVIVEGITKNGKIGYFETIYTVDKKIER
jgi:hypothetical protein